MFLFLLDIYLGVDCWVICNSIFNFLRNFQTVFQSYCTIIHILAVYELSQFSRILTSTQLLSVFLVFYAVFFFFFFFFSLCIVSICSFRRVEFIYLRKQDVVSSGMPVSCNEALCQNQHASLFLTLTPNHSINQTTYVPQEIFLFRSSHLIF